MQRTILTRPVNTLVATVLLLTLTACSGGEEAKPQTSGGALPNDIFLSESPQDAKTISELKASASEGDEVVVRVVVGGTEKPIVPGRASAAIIDATVENPCLGEDDHCQTPWDYCCTPLEDITPNLATLQITDDSGVVLKADFAPSIEPLATLVIKGIVGPRPDKQVLTINAQGIYIESKAP